MTLSNIYFDERKFIKSIIVMIMKKIQMQYLMIISVYFSQMM
jgi:hypothetical protein